MYRYTAFGLSIDSDLELPLPALQDDTHPADPADQVTVRLGKVLMAPRPAREGDEFGFNKLIGRFQVRDGRSILIDPEPWADPANLKSILTGRIMGYLLRQRGWLPLHASSVRVRGLGVLFLGGSGMGKSTTASAFFGAGHSVLSDELCAVRVRDGICELTCAGTPIRLSGESMAAVTGLPPSIGLAGDKHAIQIQERYCAVPLPVGRIYVLDFGERLESVPVSSPQAVQFLSLNSFVNSRGLDKKVAALQFHLCHSVAAAAPVRRLVRPYSLGRVSEIVSFIEDEVDPHRTQELA
jgi:hypothetical protein